MNPTRELIDRIAHKYELDSVQTPGQPLVEILGNCRVIIENHCGITGYGPNEIRVRLKRGVYFVCGAGLKIAQMNHHMLVITGRIESVRFWGGPGV